MNVGDTVRVLPPFNEAFPDTYTVEAVHEDGTCVICEDRDFAECFLELVDANHVA